MARPTRPNQPLTPAQRTIVQRKTFEGNATAQGLLDLLRPIADFDRAEDVVRARLAKLGPVLLGGGVFAAVGVLVSGLPALLLFIPVVIAAVGAACLVKASKLSKIDLPNDLRLTVLPWLSVLGEDVKPEASIFLKLDLRGYKLPEKRLEDPALDGPRGDRNAKTYLDLWMSGQAELADGSHLSWTVEDRIHVAVMSRSNARGKTKIKTKYKKKTTCVARVAFPITYAIVPQSANAGANEKCRPMTGKKYPTIAVTRVVKTLNLDPTGPGLLLDAVASAYRSANPGADASSPGSPT
jgi:hypothetical protein